MSDPQFQRRSIPQINSMVRALVEQETLSYPFWTRGFVNRYFQSDFGHTYFDLADDDHSIGCMLPVSRRSNLEFEIANGMEVEVFGPIRVYEKQAKVQIDVEQIRLINHEPFVPDEALQEQLALMGCWPPQRQALPQMVQQIGLITGKNSRAYDDFRSTFYNEGGQADVRLIDVLVGGQNAPIQIARAIERLNRENNVDVIALVRGGGRVEELAVFNDIQIARAICQSAIPVVTGIGHHQDDSLADQMADFAAITPTAAALRLAKLAQGVGVARPQAEPRRLSMSTILIIVLALAVVALVIFNLLQAAPGG